MTLLFWTWSTELNNFFIPSVVLKACTQPSVFPEINATICLTDTSNSWETKEKTCCKSITFSLERLEQSARDGIAAILFSLIWDSTDDHFLRTGGLQINSESTFNVLSSPCCFQLSEPARGQGPSLPKPQWGHTHMHTHTHISEVHYLLHYLLHFTCKEKHLA